MPFQPGHKLAGSRKGKPNKVTSEIRELALSLFDKAYWTSRRELLKENKLAPVLEAKLLSYAYGEPKQERQGNQGVTVNIGYFGRGQEPPTIDITPVPQMIAPTFVAPESDDE